MEKEFILMNKDIEVLHFTSETDQFGDTVFEQIDEETSVLPAGFYDIQSFISGRRAPKHRKHIMQLLIKSGCLNLETYISTTKALSLNDSFWVKSVDDSLSWYDVSLYQNDFDDVIANTAFSGGTDQRLISTTSPEFSTNGQYAKCWIRNEKGIHLIKSSGNGHEIYSEVYASQLAHRLCHNSVDYSITEFNGQLVSQCSLFTSEDVGYVPAIKYIDSDRVNVLLNYFTSLGFDDEFRRMVILDGIILNEDRHGGNYGFLVNNDTQEILGMAPIFDHNRSLLWNGSDDITTSLPRIGNDYINTAKLLLTPEIRRDLENLRDFEFEREAVANLPEERIRVLENVVQTQIKNILDDMR